MKSNITLYPEFLNAVQNNELVYLFGTGISASLTGKNYSWWQWVVNGISHMKDAVLAKQYQESIEADSSTENMIDIVGKVLLATKTEGMYSLWMKESFESNRVTNMRLAATLKKLLITQDVFATTNYDLLLEQAADLSTLTYEEPDKAFHMLDQRKSTCVLHIHGVYDSAHGIDNIVADKTQYEAVLNDKGAQFIQHILGTRTLVFIGCGQTTEDANIAQFIQFARTYLRMDREYYFLYKLGQKPVDMPDNIKLIPYGDDYMDLPEFMEDMAQERLKVKIENNPLVLRTVNTEKTADAYGLSEYHYSQEYLKFCGRKMELSQLVNFIETDRPFQWWALTGQGGAGKSRLAFEFLHRVQKSYFGFFLNYNVSDDAAEKFIPFRDTLVIIDYIKGNEKRIARILSQLIDQFKTLPYKLRVLLLERDNFLLAGSWYNELISALDTFHRAEFHNAEYNMELATRKHRFLYLDDLDEASVVELIGNVCGKKGLPADIARDRKLKNEYAQKFEQLRFRPLFLQIYVEAWIDNGCIAVDYVNYRSLLEVVVSREQEHILNLFDNDLPAFNALMKLVIRASVSDGIFLSELENLYPAEWNTIKKFVKTHSIVGKQRIEYLQSILKDASQDVIEDSEVLKPLYPDIIKEYMFIFYLDDEDMREMSEELWRTCPTAYNIFLSRCLVDLQGDGGLIAFIRNETADFTNLNAMQVRLALLEYKIVHTMEDGYNFTKLAKDEYAYWLSVPLNHENRSVVLQGLYLSVWQFFGWSMEKECFEAINKVAEFEAGTDIAPVKAQFLLEFVHYLTEKNCIPSAQSIISQTESAVKDVADQDVRKELWLSLQRETMVSRVYYKQWNQAWKLHNQIYHKMNWGQEKQVELYAYICFSGADLCFHMMEWDQMLYFADQLQDLAEDYASGERAIYFNDKVHYYYLHTKLMRVETVSIATHLQGWGAYGLQITNELISEIENNEMISDFAGLLVGAKALKIGTDEAITDQEAEQYLKQVDELLERYPDNAFLAEKTMDLWETAYTEHFKRNVGKDIVDRAYALALRFPQNGDVLNRFFMLLKTSKEVGNWLDYVQNKSIVTGLIENGLAEYLIPPQSENPETFVRNHPKPGRNDPCPCGSGKKFKRCCMGKGKYD